MTDKENKKEKFNPNKEVEKGPLKSEHINQYGTNDDETKNRDLAQRVPDEEE